MILTTRTKLLDAITPAQTKTERELQGERVLCAARLVEEGILTEQEAIQFINN